MLRVAVLLLAAVLAVGARTVQAIVCPTYTVLPGDTVNIIADAFGVKPEALEAALMACIVGYQPGLSYLQPGQKICLPGWRRGCQYVAESGKPSCKFYVVQPGDTATSIAASLGIRLKDMLRANPELANVADAYFQLNQFIRLPPWGPGCRMPYDNQTPPPPPPPVLPALKARAWGDRHFCGFDGSRFSWRGAPSRWHDVLSSTTQGLSLRALMTRAGHGRTLMTALELRTGGSRISVELLPARPHAWRLSASVNGRPVSRSEALGSGIRVQYFPGGGGAHGAVKVTSGPVFVSMIQKWRRGRRQQADFLDLNIVLTRRLRLPVTGILAASYEKATKHHRGGGAA